MFGCMNRLLIGLMWTPTAIRVGLWCACDLRLLAVSAGRTQYLRGSFGPKYKSTANKNNFFLLSVSPLSVVRFGHFMTPYCKEHSSCSKAHTLSLSAVLESVGHEYFFCVGCRIDPTPFRLRNEPLTIGRLPIPPLPMDSFCKWKFPWLLLIILFSLRFPRLLILFS